MGPYSLFVLVKVRFNIAISIHLMLFQSTAISARYTACHRADLLSRRSKKVCGLNISWLSLSDLPVEGLQIAFSPGQCLMAIRKDDGVVELKPIEYSQGALSDINKDSSESLKASLEYRRLIQISELWTDHQPFRNPDEQLRMAV